MKLYFLLVRGILLSLSLILSSPLTAKCKRPADSSKSSSRCHSTYKNGHKSHSSCKKTKKLEAKKFLADCASIKKLSVKELSGLCCKTTKICHLPFVITKSGKYCLCDDLVYANDDPKHVAIDIQADNVQIDLCSHSISIAPNTTFDPDGFESSISAIFFINDQRNITIHDGQLQGTKPVDNTRSTDWSAVRLIGGNTIELHRVNIKDVREGVSLSLTDPIETRNIICDQCTFTDNYTRSFEPSFTGFRGAAIAGRRINGLRVTRCTFEHTRGSNPFGSNLASAEIAFDSEVEPPSPQSGFANNALISECSFIRTDLNINWNPAGGYPWLLNR